MISSLCEAHCRFGESNDNVAQLRADTEFDVVDEATSPCLTENAAGGTYVRSAQHQYPYKERL